MYDKTLNSPFVTRKDKFNETIKEFKKPATLTKAQMDYLNSKLRIQDKWAKCFIKDKLTIGVSTTSRIKSMHSVLADKLNSNSRLTEVLEFFKKIENSHILKFNEEFWKNKKKNDDNKSFQNELLNILSKIYTPYPLKKIESKFIKCLSYSIVEEKKDCQW